MVALDEGGEGVRTRAMQDGDDAEGLVRDRAAGCEVDLGADPVVDAVSADDDSEGCRVLLDRHFKLRLPGFAFVQVVDVQPDAQPCLHALRARQQSPLKVDGRGLVGA